MTLHGARLDKEGHDWPWHDARLFVNHAAGCIHVVQVGSGPVLVLLHGTGASTHSFHALMSFLSESFTVVGIDLPGQGLSTIAPQFRPSLDGVAQVVADVLEHMCLTPRVIVGHSSGAAVAVVLAHDAALWARSGRPPEPEAQVDLVVAIGAALVPLGGITGLWMKGAARLLARSQLAARLLAWRARRPGSIERLVRSTGSWLKASDVDMYRRLAGTPGHVAGVLRMLAAWDPTAAWDVLPQLGARALFIAGAQDRAVPLAHQQQAAAETSHAEFRVIEQAGHLVHEEYPQRVAEMIVAAVGTASMGAAATSPRRAVARL